MYPKEYFLEQFKDTETDELLHRFATADLTNEAKEAIRVLLKARGIADSKLPPLVVQARKAVYRQTRGTSECDFCGSSARFYKIVDAGQRFCSKACLRNARLMEISEDIPKDEILLHARRIKNGACPACGQSSSKIEARRYYQVWSALVFTQWSNRSHVCCHSCGRKENLQSLVICVLAGWWGIPWGVIITPAQIASNIAEMFKSRADPDPSEELLLAARIDLAAHLFEAKV